MRSLSEIEFLPKFADCFKAPPLWTLVFIYLPIQALTWFVLFTDVFYLFTGVNL